MAGVPFKLQTDASDVGIINGVLYQVDDEKYGRIVALQSRVLSKYESRYVTTERELLAIVYYCVLKFRMYLIGLQFEIVTDHKALTFLLNTPYHNSRLLRWSLGLQEYNYVIIRHCRGADDTVADSFSRNFIDSDIISTNNSSYLVAALSSRMSHHIHPQARSVIKMIAELSIQKEVISELKGMGQRMKDDDTIKQLREKGSIEFREEDGVLYCRNAAGDTWKLAIPRIVVEMLLACVHEQLGHAGCYKLWNHMARFFYWKYVRRDVKRFTRSCDTCQRIKYLNFKMEGSYDMVKATRPNKMISVDFYGPLPTSTAGVQYIFIVQDLFSMLVTLYPIKRATTQIILTKLRSHYFREVGMPNKVLSDNGTQFTSRLWHNTLVLLRDSSLFVHTPSTIQPTRANDERTLERRLFRMLCHERQTGWGRQIPFVQDCLNSLIHQSTGDILYQLHFNKPIKSKLTEIFPLLKERVITHDVRIQLANERLQKAFERRCKTQGKGSKISLKEGDLVLLRVPHLSNALQKVIYKFYYLYEGPFKIIRRTGNNAYTLAKLEDESIIKVFLSIFSAFRTTVRRRAAALSCQAADRRGLARASARAFLYLLRRSSVTPLRESTRSR